MKNLVTWYSIKLQPNRRPRMLQSVLVRLENKHVTEATYIGMGKFIKHGFNEFPHLTNPITHWATMPR